MPYPGEHEPGTVSEFSFNKKADAARQTWTKVH